MTDTDFGTTAAADEQKIAKGVAVGLPLVTISVAAVVGMLVGPATSILVVAAGVLLAVIALLWASLRILSGDAPLSPELEALEVGAQEVDVLATRKKMLLRALKDLENEHKIGKIEGDDYEQISLTYREELKALLKRIDETLAPHRARAEQAARVHLRKAGIVEAGYRGPQPDSETSKTEPEDRPASETERLDCPKCQASNERDAKFCKECAARLPGSKKIETSEEEASTNEALDGEDSDEE